MARVRGVTKSYAICYTRPFLRSSCHSVNSYEQNKLFFLTYHSFLFYISKLLDVTVILYFLHSFSFSSRRRFVFQTEISGKYIVLVLILRLFYFLSSLRRGDQSTVFCVVSFDFNWSRSPKIRHPSVLVCRCGLADITRLVYSIVA